MTRSTPSREELIHAAVRYFVTRSGKWDMETYGVPVCQQDMLGALLIFPVQVIDGIRRIVITVTEQEAESYYYVWRVTGALLGIPAEAMPETLDEARQLNASLVETAYAPSAEGIALTRNLLELYEKMVPGKVFDGVAAMVRQTIDPQVAGLMDVPHSRGWTRAVRAGTRLMRVLERSEDTSKIAGTILDKAGSLLLGGSVRILTDGQSATLGIPADLKEKWLAAGTSPVSRLRRSDPADVALAALIRTHGLARPRRTRPAVSRGADTSPQQGQMCRGLVDHVVVLGRRPVGARAAPCAHSVARQRRMVQQAPRRRSQGCDRPSGARIRDHARRRRGKAVRLCNSAEN